MSIVNLSFVKITIFCAFGNRLKSLKNCNIPVEFSLKVGNHKMGDLLLFAKILADSESNLTMANGVAFRFGVEYDSTGTTFQRKVAHLCNVWIPNPTELEIFIKFCFFSDICRKKNYTYT
jgi:hypothetical protein